MLKIMRHVGVYFVSLLDDHNLLVAAFFSIGCCCGPPLISTTTSGVGVRLRFSFSVRIWLQVGCGSFCKQIRGKTKRVCCFAKALAPLSQ
jgi:hypothetical protein